MLRKDIPDGNTSVSVYDTKFFISSFWRAFNVMKNGVYFIGQYFIVYFIVHSFLPSYARFCDMQSNDLWRHIVDKKMM